MHIAIIHSDGGEPTQLTFEHGESQMGVSRLMVTKSPLLDSATDTGTFWWVSRSTKLQKQLTNYTKLNAFVRYPAWSPLGNQIVYE